MIKAHLRPAMAEACGDSARRPGSGPEPVVNTSPPVAPAAAAEDEPAPSAPGLKMVGSWLPCGMMSEPTDARRAAGGPPANADARPPCADPPPPLGALRAGVPPRGGDSEPPPPETLRGGGPPRTGDSEPPEMLRDTGGGSVGIMNAGGGCCNARLRSDPPEMLRVGGGPSAAAAAAVGEEAAAAPPPRLPDEMLRPPPKTPRLRPSEPPEMLRVTGGAP